MTDTTSATPPPTPEPLPPRRKRWLRLLIRFVLLVVVPLVGAIVAVHIYAGTGRYIATENAYVKSRNITVSADVSARILRVFADDNQIVKAGDLLIELDRAPFEDAVAEARADLEAVLWNIRTKRAELRRARREIAGAEETVRYAWQEFERHAKLSKTGAGRAARRDEVAHQLAVANQELKMAREGVRELIVGLGGSEDLKPKAFPAHRRAMARLRRSELDLERTVVRAPNDGVITRASLEAGEFVKAGDALFALVDRKEIWVEANLKETELTHITPGLAATFVLDAYPKRQWRGEVSSISPATGAEFALLPPQNASGNWVKVVQRLAVRLRVETNGDTALFRSGMSVSVSIDTKRERELPPLIRKVLAWTGGPAIR